MKFLACLDQPAAGQPLEIRRFRLIAGDGRGFRGALEELAQGSAGLQIAGFDDQAVESARRIDEFLEKLGELVARFADPHGGSRGEQSLIGGGVEESGRIGQSLGHGHGGDVDVFFRT